jgi:C-terminal processing protease CtpA/Prc
VAILTIRTFSSGAYRNSRPGYEDFVKQAFADMRGKNVDTLILDVRGNRGGADAYGKILFAHLHDKPFRYYRHLRAVDNHFSFFKYPRSGERDVSDLMTRNASGTYDMKEHPNLGMQQPRKPHFAGKVYVLIDGGSFSTTSEFMSLAHYHGRAEFIGEESAGGYYGNTSGFSARIILPNTKMQMGIPMNRYTMAVSGYQHPDRGIIPDHPVTPTIQDLVAGKDPVLDYAMGLANSSVILQE